MSTKESFTAFALAVAAVIWASVALDNLVPSWKVPSSAIATLLILAVGCIWLGVSDKRHAIAAAAWVIAFFYALNLSLLPYLGFLLFPVDILVGAMILINRTKLRNRRLLLVLLTAAARLVGISIVMSGYLRDLLT